MGIEIVKRCKECGREFSVAELSYKLKSEKGESLPEYCEECRKMRDRERKEVGIPYFQFRSGPATPCHFSFPKFRYTSHGERKPYRRERKGTLSEVEFGITDEDILNLYEKLEKNQVVVLTAPTGAGKSIFVPLRFLEAPPDYKGDFPDRIRRQGQIVVTQPTRAATENISTAIGEIGGFGVGLGQVVGFRHGDRFGSNEGENWDRWNLIVEVTDGSLRNWIMEGHLGRYSLLIIDEAHIRSCNIDMLLGFLKKELPKYPSTKLIISSATINAEKFQDTFREIGIPVYLLDIPSRRKYEYFVHFWKDDGVYTLSENGDLERCEDCNCWLCRESAEEREEFWKDKKNEIRESDLPETISNFVLRILKETEEGSILVFLYGEGVIKKTRRKTERKLETQLKEELPVVSIYSRLGEEKIEKRLNQMGEKRRVIIATNVLETSYTFPKDVVYEIDSGYQRRPKWNSKTETRWLPVERHSRDGCKQRWGRLGRVREGYIYTLYTKEQFADFEDHTPPEILESPLDDTCLILKAAGVKDIEEFPWVEKPPEEEINRSLKALQDEQIVDRKEDIFGESLELLRIPRTSNESSLLLLADEQGCLFEAMTALWLMSTRDGEPRTGANLYHHVGLLDWDGRWNANTKMATYSIHQGLKVGCQDDLAFVLKLAHCFLKAEEKGVGKKWAKRHFANYSVLQTVLSEMEELMLWKFGEQRKEEIREIDVNRFKEIRSLMALCWPKKIVELNPGEPATYQIREVTGIVSTLCAGNWEKQEKAISGAVIREKFVVEGQKILTPVASFMVKMPGESEDNKKNLFADQRFPIGSRVSLREKNGKSYLDNIEELPPPTRKSYRKTLDLSEDYLKENQDKEEELSSGNEFLIEKELIAPVEGTWIGEEKAEQATIVEWIDQEGQPVAVLRPFEESEFHKLGKKKGDTLRVKIHRVARDPVGRGGWIIARTKEGFDIPIELSEMMLSPLGYGLEQIEGQTLNLLIKQFDETDWPKLSNIHNVLNDLKNLREKTAKRGQLDLLGYVANINEEGERVVAVAIRENGVIHPFEIHKDYVPGKRLENLRIGEEITLRLFVRDGKCEIPAESLKKEEIEFFTNEEVENKLKGWYYDDQTDKISTPSFCLKDEAFKNFPFRPKTIDFVKRYSWRYCLNAQIVESPVSKEAYELLEAEAFLEGKVIEITEYEGRPNGVIIEIETKTSEGKFRVNQFMPLGEISWKIKRESPPRVVNEELKKIENKVVILRILEIDESDMPPKLFLSRKKAFMAKASIPHNKIGLLIGEGGSKKREIKGKKDADIYIDDEKDIVIVNATNRSARNSICSEISSYIWGMSGWEKN